MDDEMRMAAAGDGGGGRDEGAFIAHSVVVVCVQCVCTV